MRICDHCRDLKKPVLDLRLMIVKPDPDNGRLKPEELRSSELELCLECVTSVWEKLSPVLKLAQSAN